MWGAMQLSRCTHAVKLTHSKLLVSNTSILGRFASRQLITPIRCSRSNIGIGRGYKLSNFIKSNGIIARFCSSSPQPKPPKAVGYWLLGCSGMVFTAVVLGMVTGYLVLLYSVYYIVNIVVNSTNGSK